MKKKITSICECCKKRKKMLGFRYLCQYCFEKYSGEAGDDYYSISLPNMNENYQLSQNGLEDGIWDDDDYWNGNFERQTLQF